MELTQIKYFIAVAQTENMSLAAKRLHVSQPSLSRAVSQLEAELGCPLFTRTGRKIALNAEGKRFLKGALGVMRQIDDTTFDLREMTHEQVTHLTIGVTGNNTTLTSALMKFTRERPMVRLHINANIEAVPYIDINAYDMLIYPQCERYKKFNGTPLRTSPYLLAISRSHPLMQKISQEGPAKFKGIHVSDLADERFVFIRHGDDFVEAPYELCIGIGMHPHVRVFTNSQDMHRQIVAHGDAIGFVAMDSKDAYLMDPAIKLVPILDEGFCTQLMVCFKRDKHLSATGLELKEFITAQIAQEARK